MVVLLLLLFLLHFGFRLGAGVGLVFLAIQYVLTPEGFVNSGSLPTGSPLGFESSVRWELERLAPVFPRALFFQKTKRRACWQARILAVFYQNRVRLMRAI